MKQKTLDLIHELEKHYNVRVEGRDFRVDDFTFCEWQDDNLLVEYYYKVGQERDDYIVKDEVIPHDIEEVMWWINTGRDY